MVEWCLRMAGLVGMCVGASIRNLQFKATQVAAIAMR